MHDGFHSPPFISTVMSGNRMLLLYEWVGGGGGGGGGCSLNRIYEDCV